MQQQSDPVAEQPGTLVWYDADKVRCSASPGSEMYSTATMLATHYIDSMGKEVEIGMDNEPDGPAARKR